MKAIWFILALPFMVLTSLLLLFIAYLISMEYWVAFVVNWGIWDIDKALLIVVAIVFLSAYAFYRWVCLTEKRGE